MDTKGDKGEGRGTERGAFPLLSLTDSFSAGARGRISLRERHERREGESVQMEAAVS